MTDPSSPSPRTQLTDADTGRWVVTTLTSRYLLDLDLHQLVRRPGQGDPGRFGWDSGPPAVSTLRRDDDVVTLHSVAHCHLGESLVVLLDLRGDGVVTIRQSTQVVSIDPTPVSTG
jgi:hypothetical protein